MGRKPAPNPKSKDLHIRMEPELFEAIEAIANEKRVTISDLVRQVIEVYLE